MRGHDKYYISAPAAVTAVGTARRDILLAVERNRAVTAVAGFKLYLRFIYKHGLSPYPVELIVVLAENYQRNEYQCEKNHYI